MIASDALFAPVISTTAFEETLERLSVAIKLGLLAPGARLPAERELCEQLGIARSTLRQALTALVQSGHLVAVRGRMGGTFVADAPPAPAPPSEAALAAWRGACDTRLAVELGVAMLAAERAERAQIDRLAALVAMMAAGLEDFAAYRYADVHFHIGLAEATGSPALVAAMTDSQGAMSDLVAQIPHPPEVLAWSNAQHARLVDCLEQRDGALAVRVMKDHLRGTEHVLAGLLP
ncbi:FCD domain-containing protein [Solirubrobacter phytolaccae]|uniref:FCD domain-containing protein n=1 Tax=Solirubrobacter phytolaccae TaxID=1404360 RepID=A0A9X3S9Y4_9ACTN|nr:FCD domain-containing protein [Solirubrobacter phytolaccae]MDA0183904.1 FCD domain-containing protein [Solirubrobacter phytolaccae]